MNDPQTTAQIKALLEEGHSPETIRRDHQLDPDAAAWLETYETTQKALARLALQERLEQLDELQEGDVLPELRWQGAKPKASLRPLVPLLAAAALLLFVLWPAESLKSGETLEIRGNKTVEVEVPASTLVYIEAETEADAEPVTIRIEDAEGNLVEILKTDYLANRAYAFYQEEAARFKLKTEGVNEQTLRLSRDADLFASVEELKKRQLDMYNQAEVDKGAGKLEKALDDLNRAGLIASALGLDEEAGKSFNRAGYYTNNIGHFTKGRVSLKKAIHHLKPLGPTKELAFSLNNMGITYLALGPAEGGRSLFHEANAIFEELDLDEDLANTTTNLAVIYELSDQPGRHLATLLAAEDTYKTLPQYQELLKLQSSLPPTELTPDQETFINRLATLYSNMGNARSNLKEGLPAIVNYQKALSLAELTGTHKDHQLILANLSWAYHQAGDSESFLATSQKSLTLQGGTQNKQISNLNMGLGLLEHGDKEQAKDYLEKVLAVSEGEDRLYRFAKLGLAKYYDMLKQTSQSISYLEDALSDPNKDPYFEVQARTLLAKNFAKQGNGAKALKEAERTIAIVEEKRGKVKGRDLAEKFLASRIDPYDLKIELQMTEFFKTGEMALLKDALQTSELTRARTLFETIKEASSIFFSEAPPKLAEEKERIIAQLNDIEKKLRRLDNGYRNNRERIASLEEKKAELKRALTLVQKRIADEGPFHKEPDLKQPGIEVIQQKLDDQTQLAQIHLGQETSTLWLLDKTSIKAFKLPAKDILEKHSREMLTSLKGGVLESQDRDALSSMILEPLATELKAERLGIVADGNLQYLPWDLLKLKNDNPLLTQTEVFYLPAFSLVPEFETTWDFQGKALVFADSVYQEDDPRLKGQEIEDSFPVADTGTYRDASYWDTRLNRLPGSAREADAIRDILGGNRTVLFEGFDANKQSLDGQNLQDYQILHFATHGLLHKTYPEFSGLMLSRFDARGNTRDGFLGLYEIYEMELNGNLVVMSACETASGLSQVGEGVIGLTRAFMYAGSSRIVSTLWKVEDQSTADLMADFYNGLNRGESPARALHLARKNAWSNWKEGKALGWGGFVFTGFWK